MTDRPRARQLLYAVIGVGVFLAFSANLSAQSPPSAAPNTGALTFTGGVDAPTVYFFRGIRQEGEPKLTLQPYGDLGVAFGPRAKANVGVWESLHTGTSGTGGPSAQLHYEERFYASLTLGLSTRLSLASTYQAYTFPNSHFETVSEMSFRISDNGRFAPYALLATELSETGQADGGFDKGTYLELGAAPALPLLGPNVILSVPVKAGFSLNKYYEVVGPTGATTDNRFGFFDIGALLRVPLSSIPSRFGSWNVHGGVDFLALGKTTKAFNKGEGHQVIGSIGVGLTY